MARKIGKRDSRYLARLVTGDRAPCAFCNRNVDDEVTYGKLYAIGDIQCHYFCALLSCCLIQKGSDEDGLFGFLYKDILAELERSRKHKCSYCYHGGANLGCSVTTCRKQFHLPCGRERNAVSLYYGTYKSFCQMHAPKQVIPEQIMCKARLRMRYTKKQKCSKDFEKSTILVDRECDKGDDEMVCVICYEAVNAFPTVNTFWPPCCARDAWFHRSCLQRMALSAGMHYLKCPLCNDKANFYDAVVSQGYYVPDRDAAWELEQNAFAEIYERPLACAVEECKCLLGRGHDADQGLWDIKLCLLCGSMGAHVGCIGASATTRYICLTCTPAAPKDIQALADTIEELIQQEQANSANAARHGPVMSSRMSLRRTKRQVQPRPSSSRAHDVKRESESQAQRHTLASRQELNLGIPRKLSTHADPRISYKNDVNSPLKSKESGPYTSEKESYKRLEPYKDYEGLMSPMKLLEQSFKEKVLCLGMNNAVLDEQVVDMLRKKLKKPRPLSEKKKIVEGILDSLFGNMDSLKVQEPLREWMSPRKFMDKHEDTETIDSISKKYDDTIGYPLETPKKTKRVTAPDVIVVVPDYLSVGEIKHEIDQDVIDPPKTSNEIEPNCAKKQLSNSFNEIHNEANSNENIKHNGDVCLQDINTEKFKENHDMSLFDEDNTSRKDNTLSSDKTLQIVSEIVAETLSDANFAIDAHKRKTVDMQHDSSLEISENDQTISIDVIKNDNSLNITTINDNRSNIIDKCVTDDKKEMCAFKFSPFDNEKLETTSVDIDLEKLKKEYLNEVGREFKCCFNHNHDSTDVTNAAYRSVVDFAIEAHIKYGNKRRLSEDNLVLNVKKRKISENLSIEQSAPTNLIETTAESLETIRPITKEKSDLKNKRAKTYKRERGTRITRANYKEINNTTCIVRDEEKHVKDKLRRKDEVLSTQNKPIALDKVEQERTETSNTHETNVIAKKGDKPKRPKGKLKVKHKKNVVNEFRNNERDEIEKKIAKKMKERRVGISNDKKRVKNKIKDKDLHSKVKNQRSGNVSKVRQVNKNIEVTIDQEESQRKSNKKKKIKTKLSITNNEKDISVKIKWKRKQLRLKIESKKVKKADEAKFKQYVLQYYAEATPKEVIVKPEKEVSPLKRKYVKQKIISPDKYKQMTIQNFFKAKTANEK